MHSYKEGEWVVSKRKLVSVCVSSGRVHNCQCVTSFALHCYTVSLLKDMSTHTHTHLLAHKLTGAPASMTHKWRNGNTGMFSGVHKHLYTHATHTHYRARRGVRLVTVPVPVSVSVSPEEWGRVPSGDTQAVITKWHKRPTFLPSKPFPVVSASSSKFVYLVLTSSDSVLVSPSSSETLYSN